jgi:hypothetical protein
MDDNLKKEILDVVEFTKQCPQNLQVSCFELLVGDILTRRKPHRGQAESAAGAATEAPDAATDRARPLDEHKLPMRVRGFLKKYELTADQLGKLFLVEADQVEPTWHLKTTKFATAQIQCALLHALGNALRSGDFSFQLEEVRQDATQKSYYDSANFMATFKKNKALFDKLESESRTSLTEAGMKQLGETVQELTSDTAK